MANPYPPPPRKLVRSKSNRVVGGVCGGVAQYLNMDPTLVRILTVLIALFTGVPVVLYIVALFVVPEEGSPEAQPPQYPPVQGSFQQPPSQAAPYQPTQHQEPAFQTPQYQAQPAPPVPPQPTHQPSAGGDDAVWGTEGPPWEQREPDSGTAAPAAHEADPAESAPAPEEDQKPKDTPAGGAAS